MRSPPSCVGAGISVRASSRIRRVRWHLGTGVLDRLAGDASLNDPASESQRINLRIRNELGRQDINLIALYFSSNSTVTDPQFRDAVMDATARLRSNPGVEQVISYYETEAPTLVSSE